MNQRTNLTTVESAEKDSYMHFIALSRRDRSSPSLSFPSPPLSRKGSKLSVPVNQMPEHIWPVETRELRVKYKLWGATPSRRDREHPQWVSPRFHLVPFVANIAVRMRSAYAIERIDDRTHSWERKRKVDKEGYSSFWRRD